jgi:hypothetical protein
MLSHVTSPGRLPRPGLYVRGCIQDDYTPLPNESSGCGTKQEDIAVQQVVRY